MSSGQTSKSNTKSKTKVKCQTTKLKTKYYNHIQSQSNNIPIEVYMELINLNILPIYLSPWIPWSKWLNKLLKTFYNMNMKVQINFH